MSFHDKLAALLQFSTTQVLPVVIKNPDTQAKALPYIGLAFGAIALIEALFSHTVVPTTTVTGTPVIPAAPTA